MDIDFDALFAQVLEALQREQRISYRALRRRFNLSDDDLEDLKVEIIKAKKLAIDEDGEILVWTEASGEAPKPTTSLPVQDQKPPPITYTPKYLTEKILTSRSALEGERKHVTVCFADIKDSTELIKDLDPEDAQQLLDPAIHIMMDAVHRFEGTVNQVLGDGIMALFGAPIAHEDHAARACYAALAMQAAMQPYADEMFRSHGITMQIRVGLNSGEVVVRTIGNDLHMDYSAVGHTTNLASRMEQLAAPGSITLTGGTLRLVEGMIRVNARGPVPVKGMTEPVEVYELTGASTIRRRLQAAVARGLTKFVGRDTEIEALNHARERAEAGNGQIIAAVGEAGVGKSRLAYEFVHSHRTQGWLVLESASVSYGKATPYFPVIDLLKRYVHVEDGDEPRTIRAKVTGQIFTLDASLQETIPPLLSLLDALPEDSPFLQLDPPQRRQRTLDGLKRILLRESQVQPLLLVFEDLHWIDSETHALLDSLVESLPTAQLLLLVNYRPEHHHSWGSKTFYTQVRLDPLAPESADEFLAALLGDDPSLEPLKTLLIERTEGNPFFLEESVRMMVETQVLVGASGVYRLAQDLPTMQVPATVQAILAARIDRLSPDEKRLLQTAAVIGTEVPFPLLQTIAALSEEALHRSFAHLQAAEFLYETNLFPERVYTFKHALTQNVAYQSLLTSTRQHYHQRIAQVLAERFVETAETQPELLAHHYTEAGLYEQAVGYWQRAGIKAVQRSANAEAVSHFTKSLGLLIHFPSTPDFIQQELDVQVALGAALTVIKGFADSDVEHAYSRALELCQQLGETLQTLPVLSALGVFYRARGNYRKSCEIGEQLLGSTDLEPHSIYLLHAHYTLGAGLFWRGELRLAQKHLDQVVFLYQPQSDHLLAAPYGLDAKVHCLSYLALILEFLGYRDQASQKIQEAITFAEDLSHPYSLATATFFNTWLAYVRRDVRVTEEQAAATIALSAEYGFLYWLFTGRILQNWACVFQEEVVDSRAQIQEDIDSRQAMGAEQWQPCSLGVLAEVYGLERQLNEALTILNQSLMLVDKNDERWYEAELHRLKGELLLQQSPDNHTEAESCFQKAISIAQNQSAKSWELRAATSFARLWQSQGKRKEASDLLAPVYGWFTEGFDTADLKDAKSLLDELSEGLS